MRKGSQNMFSTPENSPVATPKGRRWLRFVGWGFLGILIIIIAALIGVSIYLNPKRIAEIIDKEASQYLDADIKVGNVEYSFIHSYPWLYFTADSITIDSRSLDSLSPELKSQLPKNADFLASVKQIKGSIDIQKLLKDEICLGDIEIISPKVNIVVGENGVANYNIVLPQKGNMKMPDIDLEKIKITPPIDISFFYIPSQLEARANIKSLDLKLANNDKLNLNIAMDGLLEGGIKNYKLSTPLPVTIKGDIAMVLNPLKAKINQLDVELPLIRLNVSADAAADNDHIILNTLGVNLKLDDLFALERKLPEQVREQLKLPEGLSGFLPLDVNLKLVSPFTLPEKVPSDFSLQELPSFLATTYIKNANLHYVDQTSQPLNVDKIDLTAQLFYDSQKADDSYLKINELSMSGEGIAIDMNVELEHLLGNNPQFSAAVNYDTNLSKSVAPILAGMGYNIAGDIKGKVNVDCGLGEIDRRILRNLAVTGNFQTNSLKLQQKGNSSLIATALAGDFDIECLNGNLETKQFNNVSLSSEFSSGSISATGLPSKSSLNVKGLSGNISASVPQLSQQTLNKGDFDIDLDFDSANMNGNGMNMAMGKVALSVTAGSSTSANASMAGNLSLSAGNLSYAEGQTKLSAIGIRSDIKASLLSSPSSPTSSWQPRQLTADENLLSSKIDHTPFYLNYSGGGMLQTILSIADIDLDANVSQATFSTPAYPAAMSFADIDLSTDLQTIKLNGMKAKVDDSSMSVSGTIDGIKSFLTSSSTSLLKADLDVNFDNVDINSLAGEYYAGVEKLSGKPFDFTMPPQGPYTKADSVCVLIPRNLQADVRLNAGSAEYMGYNFAPLSTRILLKDGDATLKNLRIGTPYADADIDWTYSTSHIDNIFMNIRADVDNFNFQNFFKAFPQLTEGTPELANLSGKIAFTSDVNFEMYPSMFMNFPSLEADFNVKGTSLEFARTGKVERITHLMEIEGSEPIAIDNININGSFHDNLLMINPFKVQFDDYCLGFAGVNNLQGDMYYHLALEKSPFHMPFAVNLQGTFKHPEVRFGGTKIKDDREKEIAADLQSNDNINIMTYLHRGWIMFVQAAGKYYLNNK